MRVVHIYEYIYIHVESAVGGWQVRGTYEYYLVVQTYCLGPSPHSHSLVDDDDDDAEAKQSEPDVLGRYYMAPTDKLFDLGRYRGRSF